MVVFPYFAETYLSSFNLGQHCARFTNILCVTGHQAIVLPDNSLLVALFDTHSDGCFLLRTQEKC